MGAKPSNLVIILGDGHNHGFWCSVLVWCGSLRSTKPTLIFQMLYQPEIEKKYSPSVGQCFPVDAIFLEEPGAPVHFQLIDIVIVFKVPAEFEVLVLLFILGLV